MPIRRATAAFTNTHYTIHNGLGFIISMAVNLLYISLTIVSKEQNGLSKSLDIFLPLNNLYDRDLKYSIFKWKSEWIELKLL